MHPGTGEEQVAPVTLEPVAFSRAGLSHRAMTIVAEAYEVDRRELIRDARLAWTWQGTGDDLVVHISRDHGWPANLTVSYLAALRRVRLWNQVDRGWYARPPNTAHARRRLGQARGRQRVRRCARAPIGWRFASRGTVEEAAQWLRPGHVGTGGRPHSRRHPPCHQRRLLPPGRGGLPPCGDADTGAGGPSQKP